MPGLMPGVDLNNFQTKLPICSSKWPMLYRGIAVSKNKALLDKQWLICCKMIEVILVTTEVSIERTFLFT